MHSILYFEASDCPPTVLLISYGVDPDLQSPVSDKPHVSHAFRVCESPWHGTQAAIRDGSGDLHSAFGYSWMSIGWALGP